MYDLFNQPAAQALAIPAPQIKNLADLKRAIRAGYPIDCTRHQFAGRDAQGNIIIKDIVMPRRIISRCQTNSFAIATEKDGKLTDSWCEYPSAKNVEFNGNSVTIFVQDHLNNGPRIKSLTYSFPACDGPVNPAEYTSQVPQQEPAAPVVKHTREDALKIAQSANLEKHLNSLIRYENRTMTHREFLHLLNAEGRTGEVAEVPKYKWDRVKYSRMVGREQDEYDAKLKEMKTEYRAVHPQGYFNTLTKSEYEYFMNLPSTAPAEDTTGPEYCTEEQLKHLFKLEHVN